MDDTPFPRKIVISPSYGAGIYTWNNDAAEAAKMLIEHPKLVEAVENGGQLVFDGIEYGTPHVPSPLLAEILKEISDKCGVEFKPYLGGFRDATVVTVHGPYRINEYDGSETVEELNSLEGFIY